MIQSSDFSSEGFGFKIFFDIIQPNVTNETTVQQEDYELIQYCKLSNNTLNKPKGKYFQSMAF